MNKTLSTVGTILCALSALIISGCFNDSSSSPKKSSSTLLRGGINRANMPTGYIGSLSINDANVSPKDIVFDKVSGELIVSGSGDAAIERGQIWRSPYNSTNFNQVSISTTAAQTFLRGYGADYDPYSKRLFVCSNPSDRMGAIHPTVVSFKFNADNTRLTWESAMNFEAKDHESCKKLRIFDGYIFVINGYADDDTYAAVYTADASAANLQATLDVSAKYSDLGYMAGNNIANKPLLMDIKTKVVQQSVAQGFDLLLLDQNKSKIYSITFAMPTPPGPLQISGNVLSRALPAEVVNAHAFVNYDDKIFFVADDNSIYSIKYSTQGGILSSAVFYNLSSHQNITGMTLGEDKLGKTWYPVFFTSSDTMYGQKYLIDEFSFNPTTGV